MRIAAVAALVLVVAALMPVRDASAAPEGSPWGADYFPNVPLTTQYGAIVHFYDDLIKGKTVVIELIYTHCKELCPLETARLAQVQKLLGERMGSEIFFYSISIDPQRDTPEQLKAYAEKFHAGPGWLFLTGKKEDIDLISKKLGLYSNPNPANRDGHTAYVMLGNEPTGQWIRNAALDNPKFLSVMIGDWLSSWKNRKPVKSYAEVPELKFDQGSYLFQSRCAACHTTGHGDSVGPDLLGVTQVRDRAWLTRFIQKPDAMLAEKDPIATELYARYKQLPMPNQGLNDTEVAALIGYLETRTPPLRQESQWEGMMKRIKGSAMQALQSIQLQTKDLFARK